MDTNKASIKIADFSYENELAKNGFTFIAGIDEVGRGCFAGPVVAGAVVFSKFQMTKRHMSNDVVINDSKKLTSKQREISAEWIKKNCLTWGIGVGSVNEINKLGIKKATDKAFRRAIVKANQRLWTKDYSLEKNSKTLVSSLPSVDFLLVDAFYIPNVKGICRARQSPIIKGDSKSISIAAASIIAKVYRDQYMEILSRNFMNYLWVKNKGYGTKSHQQAILKYGVTKHHRDQFVNTFLSRVKSSV